MSVADVKPKSSTALSFNYWFPLVATNATSAVWEDKYHRLSNFQDLSFSSYWIFGFLPDQHVCFILMAALLFR